MSEMSEMSEKAHMNEPAHRLSKALRAAKIAHADRSDVVVDMKEADRVRLELLAQDLRPVFEDVPVDDQQWDFALSSGLQPRLWIDATAHVMMARDRRTYRFVRDTRLGRIVMAESIEIKPVSDSITAYIAERIIERERMMDGDQISFRRQNRQELAVAELAAPSQGLPVSVPISVQAAALAKSKPVQTRRMAAFVAGVFWFVLGMLLACGLLVLLFREQMVRLI